MDAALFDLACVLQVPHDCKLSVQESFEPSEFHLLDTELVAVVLQNIGLLVEKAWRCC